MKKTTKVIILLMFAFIIAVGIVTLFVKTNAYKSNAGDYQFASRNSVSANYQNQYLSLRKVNQTTDYNQNGLVHIGLVVQYQNQTTTLLSEVKEYDGNLLVLIDGSKINTSQVRMIGDRTNDLILQTTNILVENQVNFIIIMTLFVGIIIYYVLLFVNRNNPKVIPVYKEEPILNPVISQPQLTYHDYSDIDKIGLDYMEANSLTISPDNFGLNLQSMTNEEISAYCEAKENTIRTPGVGKNPTSFKIKGKKSYLLIYVLDNQTKLTFKCSPIIGAELIKKSKGLIIRSSFPHGSVWFSILNSNTILDKQLKELIDIAYQLALNSV